VKKNDTIVVESVSRFARNTRDLLNLIEKLSIKGVNFISQKESIDTTTPTGKFMLTVFGAVAELERGYILERQREGIAYAKARGVKFGRPAIKLPANFVGVVQRWEQGELMTKTVLELTGLTESTFYRRYREHKARSRK
jgi:DNA invertase Pin-like site-specific DNA recombinase